MYKPSATYKKIFTISDPLTGVAVNADSLPTGISYLNAVNDAGNFALTIANITADFYFGNGSQLTGLTLTETDPLAYNGTLIDDTRLNNGSYLNVAETDPIWLLNYTNIVANNCGSNFAIGLFDNGTFQCAIASSTDTTWVANYSLSDDLNLWTTTFNSTTNDSLNNYIDAQDIIFNDSVNNFVNDVTILADGSNALTANWNAGSFNITGNANKNNWENVVILDDKESIAKFTKEFRILWKNGKKIPSKDFVYKGTKQKSDFSKALNNIPIKPRRRMLGPNTAKG